MTEQLESVDHAFSRELPECETLFNLVSMHAVRAFEMENFNCGNRMIMAHFDHDGFHHLYQCGDGIDTCHLLFWVTSWQGDDAPESVALALFGGQYLLMK